MAYFERTGPATYAATEHVQGAWSPDEQHIAPALGLTAHAIERDRDQRRDDGLVLARLSCDILGTVPVAEVAVDVRVLRPGRTIELVEAALTHGERTIVLARGWLMQGSDTSAVAGSALDPMPDPDDLAPWRPADLWPGGFIETARVRRDREEPGRGRVWVSSEELLLDGEEVSGLSHLVRLADIANGMSVREDPRQVHFPNLDLTLHAFRQPRGDWLGLDTTVSFGPGGVGLTSSRLHDLDGPWGTLAQILTVRPR